MRDQIERFVQDPESLRLLQQERLILDVTDLIAETMKANHVRRADLAKSLGRTRGRITQLLDGSENLTLRTIADVFTAMGKMLCVRAESLSLVEKPWEVFESPVKYQVSRKQGHRSDKDALLYYITSDELAA